LYLERKGLGAVESGSRRCASRYGFTPSTNFEPLTPCCRKELVDPKAKPWDDDLVWDGQWSSTCCCGEPQKKSGAQLSLHAAIGGEQSVA
jgi:hypothetical protein